MPVELYKWNPRRPVIPGAVGRRIPIRRRLNNFGDLLGPMVVERLLEMHGAERNATSADVTLMSVGSVMHLAPRHAVVWGTGINGKMPLERRQVQFLDVRAVRGPRTRDRLRALGVPAPAVYGDPALLFPMLWDTRALRRPAQASGPVYVPNFNDARKGMPLPGGVRLLRPTTRLSTVVEEIANAELVVGSSLHAIVLAESMGVPARGIVSNVESRFKYDDYFFGTGRHRYRMANDVREAVQMGGERPLQWEAEALLAAFPWDLWDVPVPTEFDGMSAGRGVHDTDDGP